MSAEPQHSVAHDDYELIEAAVMETARGRWFLAEHARRERAAERAQLLFSLRKLERAAEDNLELMRFHAAASELAEKLDEAMRLMKAASLQIEDRTAQDDERRLVEQRLIEPRAATR